MAKKATVKTNPEAASPKLDKPPRKDKPASGKRGTVADAAQAQSKPAKSPPNMLAEPVSRSRIGRMLRTATVAVFAAVSSVAESATSLLKRGRRRRPLR